MEMMMWEQQGVRTVGSVKRAEHFSATQKTYQVSSQVVVKVRAAALTNSVPLIRYTKQKTRGLLSYHAYSQETIPEMLPDGRPGSCPTLRVQTCKTPEQTPAASMQVKLSSARTF